MTRIGSIDVVVWSGQQGDMTFMPPTLLNRLIWLSVIRLILKY